MLDELCPKNYYVHYGVCPMNYGFFLYLNLCVFEVDGWIFVCSNALCVFCNEIQYKYLAFNYLNNLINHYLRFLTVFASVGIGDKFGGLSCHAICKSVNVLNLCEFTLNRSICNMYVIGQLFCNCNTIRFSWDWRESWGAVLPCYM